MPTLRQDDQDFEEQGEVSQKCPYCGKIMLETGAPLWEIWCQTPECIGRDRERFFAELRKAFEASELEELARLRARHEEKRK